MSIGESFLAELDNEMENTRRVLAAIPEGKWDWKPHTKSMSLGALTGHVAGMTSWGVGTMKTDSLSLSASDYKPFQPKTTAEVVETFERDRVTFRELLAAADDDAMLRVWSMTWNGQKIIEMPRAEVVRSVIINHMIHHRGQLTVYLRLLDAPVPGTYGPSADEMPSLSN